VIGNIIGFLCGFVLHSVEAGKGFAGSVFLMSKVSTFCLTSSVDVVTCVQ
jgi:hypothetical protein